MEQKRTVLILAARSEAIKARLQGRFSEACELLFSEDVQNIDAAIRRAEVIVGEPEEAQLQTAQALRLLQITWAGADKFAAMQKFPAGVTLANVSGAFGTVISEYVIGSVVAFYRAFALYWRDRQHHVWEQKPAGATVFGKQVLVLGMGDLGGNVARRFQAFGAHVTGVRRTQRPQLPAGFERACTMEDLDAALPEADIVVNCLPSTPKTAGLMTRGRLMAMKKGALFVNVGRGSFVRNDDLVFALESGHLGGAVLDVFEREPLDEASPLWDMENVLMTPHIAGPSFEGNVDVQDCIWEICMENLERYLKGEPLRHVVDRKAGY